MRWSSLLSFKDRNHTVDYFKNLMLLLYTIPTVIWIFPNSHSFQRKVYYTFIYVAKYPPNTSH